MCIYIYIYTHTCRLIRAGHVSKGCCGAVAGDGNILSSAHRSSVLCYLYYYHYYYHHYHYHYYVSTLSVLLLLLLLNILSSARRSPGLGRKRPETKPYYH